MTETTDPFQQHLAAWRAWADAPWGRIRFAVVRETLDRHLAGRAAPLRVLDVGGGDGRDSIRLAEAGHAVVVTDTAPGMLAEARRRAEQAGVSDRVTTLEASIDDLADDDSFHLVLCHFLLHYRAADAGDVRRLAGALRPGGLLSVTAPNAAGSVLQKLARNGPAAAWDELMSDAWDTVVFQHSGRKVSADEVTAEIVEAGLEPLARYAGRVANDLLTDDAVKLDPAYFDDLLRLELALCDREPFARMGMFWQVVARKPS